MSYLFYVFAILAIITAGGIIFISNLLHAAFLLMGSFLCVAAVFVFAGADFLAVTQIMIYVGGILVLILFGIMLTKREKEDEKQKRGFHLKTVAVAIFTFIVLINLIIGANFSRMSWIVAARNNNEVIIGSTVQNLGISLATQYLMPFEAAGIILLLALIGAAYIAGKNN